MNNSLINCKGSITLRHGNRNVVHRNLIDQKNKSGCAGIRVIGESHTVSENVLKNIPETSSNRTAMCVVAGQNNPALNGYATVKNVTIKNNSIVDCKVGFAIGTKVKNDCTKKPSGLVIKDNVYAGDKAFNSSSSTLFNNDASYSNNTCYTGNLGNVSSNSGIKKKSYSEFNASSVDMSKCGAGKVSVTGTNKEKYDALKNMI